MMTLMMIIHTACGNPNTPASTVDHTSKKYWMIFIGDDGLKLHNTDAMLVLPMTRS